MSLSMAGVLKLDHLVALLTIEVLVLRIAVVVLEVTPRTDVHAAQKTGIDEFFEGAVNGRPAHPEARLLHIVHELIGVEMVCVGRR